MVGDFKEMFVLIGIPKEPNWLGSEHIPLPIEGHNKLFSLTCRCGLNALTAWTQFIR